MIELDGGIVLPMPKRAKGFTRPHNTDRRRWDTDKVGRWYRAYTHCLYSLPLHFELPLHTVVPKLAKKMLGAGEPFNIALRFMGEMESQGYITLERGFDERIVMPTKKFYDLKLNCERAPDSAISFPKLTGEDIPRAPIRGGIANRRNKEISKVSEPISSEEFEINSFALDLIEKFPPQFDKSSSLFMYDRAISSAKKMQGKLFKFPYFLDSRGRAYVDTTCGFSPQGADHEKALIIPTYAEVLTEDGYAALLETAKGYSEKDWSPEQMAMHAANPSLFVDTWKEADKPYCYMVCADLIRKYLSDPNQPLPSFIPLDGRCSGLQHWSAVVRSNAITRHLGMHQEEDEYDIYEKIAFEWKKTLPEEFKYLATRKAAKIPVMTWGYNATMMTAMEHMSKLFGAKSVWDKMELRYYDDDSGLDRATTSKYGCDLYKHMQSSLGALQHAVSWVSSCAVVISKVGNIEIKWPTPDNFMCLQRKVVGERLDLCVKLSSGVRFSLQILDFSGEIPNAAKHKSAIAPNVIHSLDATHLRMVARRLQELGLPMIFIHDSFATHCNHRSVLYKIIVEEFIKLYSREYLAELKEFWENTYGVELDSPPELGSWEPESLNGLDKFFL